MISFHSILWPIAKFLRLHFLGYFYRWPGRYINTGRIALCCIAKSENRYIRDFVEYYKGLHFDRIIVYDNNDPEGERFEDVIGDYIASGFVEIVDFRGRKVAQLKAYDDCYAKNSNKYDWIAFFDCDEFLTFVDDTMDIHSFLSLEKFLPFQAIHINWMIFGDNDQLGNDGRNIVDRFPEPCLPLDFCTRERPWNDHVKSILRGGVSSFRWKSPHTPNSDYLFCSNSEGKRVDLNSPYQEFVFTTAYLRHYRTKTIGEWVGNKMKRGFPDSSKNDWEKVLTVDHFFEYNRKTPEKMAYLKKLYDSSLIETTSS